MAADHRADDACASHSDRRLFGSREAAAESLTARAVRAGVRPDNVIQHPKLCRACSAWYVPAHVCRRHPEKSAYPTEAQALAYIRQRSRKSDTGTMEPYLCVCGSYHVWNGDPSERRRRQRRAYWQRNRQTQNRRRRTNRDWRRREERWAAAWRPLSWCGWLPPDVFDIPERGLLSEALPSGWRAGRTAGPVRPLSD